MLNNMTALVSAFARLYHTKNATVRIYEDRFAEKIISENEYNAVALNMKNGIKFFDPDYVGKDPLKRIVNNNLAPSVLARSALCERRLINAVSSGTEQYVVLASGYDTSAFGVPETVRAFELDKPEMIEDKRRRAVISGLDRPNITYIPTDFNEKWIDDLTKTNYNPQCKTFCSMLGISYYLEKQAFADTVKQICSVMPKGSEIVFDYPVDCPTSKERINSALASGANESMKSAYSFKDIEDIARTAGTTVSLRLTNKEVDETLFKDYNETYPNDKIVAPSGVEYAVLRK